MITSQTRALGALLIMTLFLGMTAKAAPLRVGATHTTYRSGIIADTMGPMCFAFNIGSDHLPCQPADIVFSKEGDTQIQLYGANNLKLTPEAIELLGKDQTSPEFLEQIFNERRSSEFQGHLELSSRRDQWSWAVTPIRIFYQSSFYNEALTEARLLAFQEKSAQFQWAYDLKEDWALGIQTRAVHRRFVSQSFFLSDAYAESGKKLLDPEEQTLVYLEPGIQYQGSDSPWRPRFGASVVNLGVTNRATSFSQRPQMHIAGSVNPDLNSGKFGVGFDLFLHEDIVSAEDALYLGFHYAFPALQVFGSLSESTWGLGFNLPLGSFELAAGLRREKIEFEGINPVKDHKASVALSFNF